MFVSSDVGSIQVILEIRLLLNQCVVVLVSVLTLVIVLIVYQSAFTFIVTCANECLYVYLYLC